MAFVKKTWKDRLVEFPGRRLLKRISGSADSQMVVDVTRNEGTVSQGGDAFSAANMNDLEQRIADEFDEVTNNLTALNDNGTIEDFHIGEDGKPYITYKVGADTVSKKLGDSEFIALSSAKSSGKFANTINISHINGYEDMELGKDIFLGGITFGGESIFACGIQSYNPKTGIVTASANRGGHNTDQFTIYVRKP